MMNYDPRIFKNDKPPPGYIPGLGRGAVGFSTRGDIGSASAFPEVAGGVAAGRGRGRGRGGAVGAGGGAGGGGGGGEDAAGSVPGASSGNGNASGVQFDKFAGYSERLFADGVYEADDAEADRIYNSVEDRMEARNKRRREVKEQEEAQRAKLDNTRIGDQFQDLKRDLSKVTEEEWLAIPDIGDHSLKYKVKKLDRITPVPDSVIEMGRGSGGGGGSDVSIDARGAGGGGVTDIKGLSEARGQMLSLRLGKLSDHVGGQTVVDPRGYLTQMSSSSASGTGTGVGGGPADADIADIKKARLLLKSVITTNRKHGPGWIAAARLEEQVRNLPEARRLIREGCAHCPDDEDVWLEAARLQVTAQATLVLADAVRHIPRSVKLWILAAEMESGIEQKKAVLRKALTIIPASESLWKVAVALESPEDAKVMLARAVECVPLSLDLWLALARLETYENAQRVLNQARLALSTEPLVWLTAARLEETQGKPEMVEKVISRALKSLSTQGVILDREAWIKHAEDAERAGSSMTCAAIIRHVLDLGVEEVDRRRTWNADADALEARGSILTARAVHARLLQDYPSKETIWLNAANFEKKHGATPDALDSLLRRAVSHCPQVEVLWLMAAKEAWLRGRAADARLILREAFAANPDSEAIWLAAAKLEWETGEIERARALLEKARAQAPSARVWMKAAMIEREISLVVPVVGGGVAATATTTTTTTSSSSTSTMSQEKLAQAALEAEESLLVNGLRAFSTSAKLWLMLGQHHERRNIPEKAREAYQAGVKACPTSIALWKAAAQIEEKKFGAVTKARTILETARFKNPKTPALWLETIRLERRIGGGIGASTTGSSSNSSSSADRQADALMARALQECPQSGLLLAEDIETAPRPARKRKSLDALQKNDADPYVVLAVAKLFWLDRKYEKAKKWFERAAALDPDLGDAWILWYSFEVEQGDDASREDVKKKCIAADPAHGERWTSVSKRPENRTLSKGDVLVLAVQELAKEQEMKRGAALEQGGGAGGGGGGGGGGGAGNSHRVGIPAKVGFT